MAMADPAADHCLASRSIRSGMASGGGVSSLYGVPLLGGIIDWDQETSNALLLCVLSFFLFFSFSCVCVCCVVKLVSDCAGEGRFLGKRRRKCEGKGEIDEVVVVVVVYGIP